MRHILRVYDKLKIKSMSGSVDFIFSITVLIMSVVVHEVSHGYAAYSLGDPTAKNEGRLTLNPLKHLDPFGSVLLPLILVLIRSPFIFGWARPVPYNPYNLSNQRWGPALVGAAGPASNIFVAFIFGILGFLLPLTASIREELWVKFVFGFLTRQISLGVIGSNFVESVYAIFLLIIFINLLLAFFNLVPIPPLDGSKVLFALIGRHWPELEYFMERWGFMVLIFFIFFLFRFIFPVILWAFRLITGVGLF